nr:hypothetical protein [Tanacetum cinerariifolium]
LKPVRTIGYEVAVNQSVKPRPVLAPGLTMRSQTGENNRIRSGGQPIRQTQTRPGSWFNDVEGIAKQHHRCHRWWKSQSHLLEREEDHQRGSRSNITGVIDGGSPSPIFWSERRIIRLKDMEHGRDDWGKTTLEHVEKIRGLEEALEPKSRQLVIAEEKLKVLEGEKDALVSPDDPPLAPEDGTETSTIDDTGDVASRSPLLIQRTITDTYSGSIPDLLLSFILFNQPSPHLEHHNDPEHTASDAHSFRSSHHKDTKEGVADFWFVPNWGLCDDLRICTFRACKELVSHLATPAKEEFLGNLSNVEVVSRAYQSLGQLMLILLDRLKDMEHGRDDWGKTTLEHVEKIRGLEVALEPKSRQLVIAEEKLKVLEGEKDALVSPDDPPLAPEDGTGTSTIDDTGDVASRSPLLIQRTITDTYSGLIPDLLLSFILC